MKPERPGRQDPTSRLLPRGRALLALCALGSALLAQEGASSGPADEDPARYGPAPEILDDPDLGRLLRRARELRDRGELEAAMAILQSELERTVEPTEGPTALTPDPEDPRRFRSSRAALRAGFAELGDEAARIRESRDGGAARRAFEEASNRPGTEQLLLVVDRFLLTAASADALLLAGDRQLDQGDAAGALRSYRDLRAWMPQAIGPERSIDPLQLTLREVTALELLGRRDEARRRLDNLADGSTPVLGGQPRTRADLRERGVLGPGPTRDDETAEPDLSQFADGEPWTVLWEYRFAEPRPYRIAQPGNRERIRILPRSSERDAGGVDLLPFLDHIPGTHLGFAGGRVLAFDHQRPIAFDPSTGRREAVGEGETEPATPETGALRNRIPILDYERAVLVDGGSVLLTTQTPRATTRIAPPSPVVAFDPDRLAEVWSTADHEATRDWMFLAAPTVEEGLAVAPFKVGDTIGVAALSVTDGALAWRTQLHGSGSFYRRPPSPRVTIGSGSVFVTTNAGVAACLDLRHGEVRWLRRYERAHPTRSDRNDAVVRQNPWPSALRVARHRALLGFVPTPPLLFEDLVILAPSDGDLLLALNAIDGSLVWLLPREVRGNVSSRRYELETVLGIDDGRLMLSGPDELVAVEARTGVRLWREQVPGGWTGSKWRGRGLCADGYVALPGEEQVMFRSLDEDGGWVTNGLPMSAPEMEPLEGSCNLFFVDDVLIIGYQSGLRALTKPRSLIAIAERSDDPEARLRAWLQAGLPERALEELISHGAEAGWRPDRLDLALRLASEVSTALARTGDPEAAFRWIGRLEQALQGIDGPHPIAGDRLLVIRAETHRELGELEQYRTLMSELRDRQDGGGR